MHPYLRWLLDIEEGLAGEAGQVQGQPGLFPFLKQLLVLHIDCGQHPEGSKANEGAETLKRSGTSNLEIQRINAVGTGKVEGGSWEIFQAERTRINRQIK